MSSDGPPYEKRVDAKGRVLNEKCIADEVPFEKLPEGWAWSRLEGIGDWKAGATPAKSKSEYYANGTIPWLLTGDLNDGVIDEIPNSITEQALEECSIRLNPAGSVLIAMYGATIGKIGVLGIPATTNQACCACILHDEAIREWLVAWLLSYKSRFVKLSMGGAQPNISRGVIISRLLPVPPLAEQSRIVKRVGELMPLVEEYGKLEDAREALDAALPERLRKSVLQMAVQGKLAPQDPADEPASVLLERIRGQRRKLIAEKKMKAPKGGESVIFRGSDGRRYEKRVDAKGRESEPVCIEDEIPFDVPDSWEWVRLETVATYIQRGKSPKYSSIEEYPVVAQKCNQWSGFSLEKAKFIDPDTVCKYGNERILQDGDLLWNSTGLGTLGRMAIYDSSKNKYSWAVADSHVTVIRTRENWFDYRFAFAYFAGPSVQSVIEEQASGSTKQKELAQETVKNYLIPIPSLAEQRRIVAQLEAVLPRITKQ